MNKIIKFPKTFQFGAAMSALQTEGKGTTEIGKLAFDKFYEEHPEWFYDGVGPTLTSDIMNHYEEDIKMFKEIGFNSVRTGFSWARLFPDGEKINEEAVKFYHDYIAEYKKNKILIYMTLFHFDMPLWAQEKGGWSSKEVIESFVKYAKFVFNEFGNEVDYYVTFNEPLVPVYEGYLNDRHYPAINDPKQAVRQAYGIFLAHSKVLKEFRMLGLNSKIGVVYNWNYTYPLSDEQADIEAAKVQDAYVNRGPLKIMYNGTIDPLWKNSLAKYDLLPDYSDQEISIIRETKVDFLGINYYFPCRVEKKECSNPRWALDLVNMRIPENAKINKHRNWEIYPEALLDIGLAVKEELDNISWYIAENGMGFENETVFKDETGIIQDNYRIEFIQNHLEYIKKAIDMNSNCYGYHLWAAIDCWSFRNAYKNRYGLIEVDLKDQKRYFKKSAFWYKKLILNRE